MARKTCMLAVAGVALTIAACSKADAPKKDAEPAPIPAAAATAQEGTAATGGASPIPGLSDGDRAVLATLSPDEISMIMLGCLRPITTAKQAKTLFSPEVQAQLDALPTLSEAKILARPPLNTMDAAQLASTREMGPAFSASGPAPSEADTKALQQCIVITNHYAPEIAEG